MSRRVAATPAGSKGVVMRKFSCVGRVFAVVGLLALAGSACDDGKRNNNSACAADDECGSGFCLVVCLDPEGDVDGDGLVNRLEKAVSTRADVSDTDGDGVNDFAEVGDETLTPLDSDADGMIDALESKIEDADGDCVSDQLDAVTETQAQLVALHCAVVGVCAAADAAAIELSCADGLTGEPPTCGFAKVPGYASTDDACDGADADCDGATDEDFASAACERTNALGTCGGSTLCQAGVPRCEAPEPAGEVCDGIDQDCDGQTDEATCDDGDECTVDTCAGASGCQNVAADCDDSAPCTVDACDPVTGECTHAAKVCDDGDACTVDECDAESAECESVATSCDDGDPCTMDSCDSATGACAHPPKSCDDEDDCTVDQCVAETGACEHAAVSCDDGDACTADTCDGASGECQYAAVACDLGPCVIAGCEAEAGCVAAGAVSCDDGDACTEDSCDETSGCVHAPTDCSDGDACNGVETCDPAVGCVSASSVVYVEDFEGEVSGWETGLLDPQSGAANTWVLAAGSGGTTPVLFESMAYGTVNTGNEGGYEQSYLLSPEFDVTGGAIVSFRTFVSNEGYEGDGESAVGPPVNPAGGGEGPQGPLSPDDVVPYNSYDMEFLQLSTDGGATWRNLLPPPSLVWYALPEPGWVDVSVPVPTAGASATTRFRFVYDTGDDCCGPEDVVGWFIDDFTVTVGGGLVCDGTDTCVTTSCDPAIGCVVTPAELDCADTSACTADFCHPEVGCVNADVSFQCDDGDLCNGFEQCDSELGCLPQTSFDTYETFASLEPEYWSWGPLGETDGSYWGVYAQSGGDAPLVFDSQAMGSPNAGPELGAERTGAVYGFGVDMRKGGRLRFRSLTLNQDWTAEGRDSESVEVSSDGGESWTVLIDPTDPRWVSDGEWELFDEEIAGAPELGALLFRFVYDTVDDCCGPNGPEGWFIDDVRILAYADPTCDDGDECTIDSCEPDGLGCVHEPDPSCSL
jgi:hypothetical protein